MGAQSKLPTITTKSIPYRKQFHDARKEPNECASDWLARIRVLAKPCVFGKDSNTFILDKFIVSLDDEFIDRMRFEHKIVNITNSLEFVRRYESDSMELKDNHVYDTNLTEVVQPTVIFKEEVKQENDIELAGSLSLGLIKDCENSSNNDIREIESEQEYDIESIEKAHLEQISSEPIKIKIKKSRSKPKKTELAPIELKPKRKYKQRAIKAKQVFECEICHYKCAHECHLRRHKLIHLNEKSFVCHLCGKGFNLFINLSAHIKRHLGDKPHTCEICQLSFIHRSKLKLHLRTHTGEKPFPCSVCAKQFAAKSYLTTHMRIHTGEKPYHCDICQKSFSQASSLITHKKTH